MIRILPFIILLLFGCENKNYQTEIRQTEAISLIQSIIEQHGKEMVLDYSSKEILPICLNLKKVTINSNCFTKAKSSVKIVKLPEKSFKNKSEICIEKFFRSRSFKNSFFDVKDSLNLVNQNDCIDTLIISKSITKNFKTIEYTNKIKIAEKYIQFSFPIFSKDNKKAYVECDHYFPGEAAFGWSLYLEKIKGKWKIVKYEGLWDI